MRFSHAKPAWVYPRQCIWCSGTEWRPGLWLGTTEKGPHAGWHRGVWWDGEGKQHAFHLPPDHLELQPRPPTLAKPQRTP